MKIAIIHDWLTGMRGGEKVLESLCELYPEADIFTLLHVKGSVSTDIEKHKIFTSFLQRMPFVAKKYRYYLPLMPFAIERLDLKGYDLIISSSHCVAKGVKPDKTALHVCYCHSPMRYIWDMYEHYFGTGRAGFFARIAMRIFRSYLQKWDVESSCRVNYFVANSRHIAKKIKSFYSREADVVYPPVDVQKIDNKPSKIVETAENKEFYLVVSAFAPYKRIDLAIKVFNKLGYKLKIVGTGQDEKRLKSIAKNNIEFLGYQEGSAITQLYGSAKALIFPGEEDFGIVPVEAMACGTPVVAYGSGGATETVVDGRTGVLFVPQTEEALISAVLNASKTDFNKDALRKHAESFSKERFKENILKYIVEKQKSSDKTT